MGFWDGKPDRPSSHRAHSTGSIFGGSHHNASRSSFFGGNNGHSSSYYKRSPRSGYLQRMYHKLRRLLRDLIHYMKKNPVKVFVLVIMPLITGGALSGLLRQFGIRLPAGLEKMFGGAGDRGRGGSSGVRDRHGDFRFEREHYEGPLGGGGGWGNSIGSLMSVAKLFI